MRVEERPRIVACHEAAMIGIIHRPRQYGRRAVLIVVGGPQTRVGSHRQFVLLARDLAAHGIAVMRFDYRGMGDSEGPDRGFEHAADDVEAAIDALVAELPDVSEVVLWGLCDAASVAMMYAPRDPRVTGIILLNPWVRSEQSEARAYLQHYYLTRLVSRDFWKRLIGGRVNVADSIGSLSSYVGKLLGGGRGSDLDRPRDDADPGSFIDRMLAGLEAFSGRVLLIMSGDDLTAAEFRQLVDRSRRWKAALSGHGVVQRTLPDANHTFSKATWRDQVAEWSREWVEGW